MTLATKLSEVCDALVFKLEVAAPELGIADKGVFYGDQARLPVSPAVCVEPNEKRTNLYAVGRMTEVTLSVYILVYHSDVKDVASNRRDADILAEDISDLLNADAKLDNTAIHSYVTNVQSGYSTKANSTMRSTRITFEIETQERLPQDL